MAYELVIEKERKNSEDMSNEELFDEMLHNCYPDGYDGMFTQKGDLLRSLYIQLVKERLGDWLKK